MKSHFSRVVALGVLFCAILPSAAQISYAPDVFPTNVAIDGVALIGKFYGKMRYAKTFRGQLVITAEEPADKSVAQSKLEIQSSWANIGGNEGALNKSASTYTQTYFTKDWREVKKYSSLVVDAKTYTVDYSDRFWSKRERMFHDDAFLLQRTRYAWYCVLDTFNSKKEFETKVEATNGKKQIVMDVGTRQGDGFVVMDQYVFDAKTGNLLTWTRRNDGVVRTYRWTQTEFDMPLPKSAFKWTVPKGTTEVQPERIRPNLSLE